MTKIFLLLWTLVVLKVIVVTPSCQALLLPQRTRSPTNSAARTASNIISRPPQVLFLPLQCSAGRGPTTTADYDDAVVPKEEQAAAAAATSCQFCQEAFGSRNALFRHLKSNRECSLQANLVDRSDSKPHSLALQFSYYYRPLPNNNNNNHEEEEEEEEETESEAQRAGTLLQQAIPIAIQQYIRDSFPSSNKIDQDPKVTILGSSQSSLARLRHRALDQERGCLAAGDTMVVRIQGPYYLDFLDSTTTRTNEEDLQNQRHFLKHLIRTTNQLLLLQSHDDDSPVNEKSSTIVVQLEACKILSPEYQSKNLMHCEQSCTQRAYHYLLPLRWLPDGKALEEWWVNTAVSEVGSHTNRSSERPPSTALKRMKGLLRSAESERLDRSNPRNELLNTGSDNDDDDIEGDDIRKATGRFGALGEKKRRAWHNFADPWLKGSASPNTKPVWRVLDRARFQLLVSRDLHHASESKLQLQQQEQSEKEVVAILEFRGDDFLPQQIRRLVGTTLAMTHGWLPETTLEVATRADCFLETPLAPAGRLYLVENRFHWDEMRTWGKSIFKTDVDGVAVSTGTTSLQDYDGDDSPVHKLQSSILDACDSDTIRERESRWLSELQDTVCPRIQHRLGEWLEPKANTSREVDSTSTTIIDSLPPPPEYQRTLHLLREIIAAGRWPETSVAQSSVIGNVNRGSDDTFHKKGSFTVINPLFRNGIYKDGVGNDGLPKGNRLFPELVEAVFDLERELASSKNTIQQAEDDKPISSTGAAAARPMSSHCAINCNAQFTPHVDSGRGAGQSLSMIVGLGDYVGGALGVEGEGYDIRYQPLEFDGWRLRHWTKAFEGERYSLVWFTPEFKGDEELPASSDC